MMTVSKQTESSALKKKKLKLMGVYLRLHVIYDDPSVAEVKKKKS